MLARIFKFVSDNFILSARISLIRWEFYLSQIKILSEIVVDKMKMSVNYKYVGD